MHSALLLWLLVLLLLARRSYIHWNVLVLFDPVLQLLPMLASVTAIAAAVDLCAGAAASCGAHWAVISSMSCQPLQENPAGQHIVQAANDVMDKQLLLCLLLSATSLLNHVG
jgi:hypothetical protein